MTAPIALAVAPSLASQSGALAADLIPVDGWLNTALRATHMLQFYFTTLTNYDHVTHRPVQFGIGTVLYAAAGNNLVVREIARFALAVRIYKKTVADGKKVIAAKDQLATTIHCTYPVPTAYLKKLGELDARNPEIPRHLISQYHSLPECLLTAVIKVEQVVTNTFSLFKTCALFLPNLLNITNLLTYDSYTQMSAIAQLPANLEDTLRELACDKDKLSREIEENRDAYTTLLQKTSSPLTVDQLKGYLQESTIPRLAHTILGAREVIVDAAVTVTYGITGTMLAPCVPSTRRLQSIPNQRRPKDDNYTTPSETCLKNTSSKHS